MKKTVLIYGVSLALLVLLLKFLQYRFLLLDLRMELYAGIIALLFTLVGLWAGKKLVSPRIIHKEQTALPVANEQAIQLSGLSKRELEVLDLMSQGFSNQEIADKIFISISTVKSHAAGIYLKLDAKRRTEAIRKAKDMGIIA